LSLGKALNEKASTLKWLDWYGTDNNRWQLDWKTAKVTLLSFGRCILANK